ncbi:FAD-binding oxidoreductase [Alphaproteobacteria bacterium]|nr:FAD-binding oxidoreductase [Alphaproteobacteria bacterium]
MIKKIPQHHIEKLKEISGFNGWINEPTLMQNYLSDQRNIYKNTSQVILRPNSTDTVSKIVSYCYENKIPIVPQGGNTGLVGGTTSGIEYNEIIINLDRMQSIREILEDDSSIIVESGIKLFEIQKIAKSINKIFPLSLASEGSCQIGGNLATNAGGIHVIRYGNTRDLVLGIEVVLSNGSIINNLKVLKKNNAGYDLKNLFIGSEGTLGIITAAALKLFPMPYQKNTMILSVDNLEKGLKLYSLLKNEFGENISAFEFMSQYSLELANKHILKVDNPFKNERANWYFLINIDSNIKKVDLTSIIEETIHSAIKKNIISNALISQNLTQSNSLWKIRESIPEAQKREGRSIKNDISVPISLMPNFISTACKKIKEMYPDILPCIFGHFGDGNIHFNFSIPKNYEEEKYRLCLLEIKKIINELTALNNGSISAEHGIGLAKRKDYSEFADTNELETIKKIKKSLDPKSILNPGKIF